MKQEESSNKNVNKKSAETITTRKSFSSVARRPVSSVPSRPEPRSAFNKNLGCQLSQ